MSYSSRNASACVIGLAFVSVFGKPAHASDATPAQVTSVATDLSAATGYIFQTAGTRSTRPACATDVSWAIITPTTDKAKAMHAAILTASASKQQVYVAGNGSCDTANPNRKSVAYITLLP